MVETGGYEELKGARRAASPASPCRTRRYDGRGRGVYDSVFDRRAAPAYLWEAKPNRRSERMTRVIDSDQHLFERIG